MFETVLSKLLSVVPDGECVALGVLQAVVVGIAMFFFWPEFYGSILDERWYAAKVLAGLWVAFAFLNAVLKVWYAQREGTRSAKAVAVHEKALEAANDAVEKAREEERDAAEHVKADLQAMYQAQLAERQPRSMATILSVSLNGTSGTHRGFSGHLRLHNHAMVEAVEIENIVASMGDPTKSEPGWRADCEVSMQTPPFTLGPRAQHITFKVTGKGLTPQLGCGPYCMVEVVARFPGGQPQSVDYRVPFPLEPPTARPEPLTRVAKGKGQNR